MLGDRLTNLLSLLSQDEFQTADQLAERMKISSKTVRLLLKQLDGFLVENGARITTIHGKGFKLQVDNFEYFHNLFIKDNANIPNGSQERVQYLLEYFLSHDEYVKVEELCDMLYVSRKTLAVDLKKVEDLLLENEIVMVRKPYYGMKIAGDEFNIRRCIVKNIENKLVSSLPDIGSHEELNAISECLMECLENETYNISDIGLQNLIVHIHVAIKRIQYDQYIPLPPEDYSEWVGEDEYNLAEKCAAHLEKHFQISFPKREVVYMAIHFSGKKSGGRLGNPDENLVISNEIHQIAQEMLAEVNEIFCIDLREDLELIMALGRHLIPLSVRLRFGMQLQNPLLGEIRERFSLAYAMAIQACSVLERHYLKLLDPNEIAYIALAFALALERRRTKRNKKTVLLVCASGVGTAKLLEYKILDMFSDCIEKIITCSEHSVKKQDFSTIDCIFTTVQIKAKVPVPICEVKYFFGATDISATRRMLESGKSKDIMQYYPRELFLTGVHFETKEHVIRYMCEEIAKTRMVSEKFYDAVMRREQLAQTCMGNKVAMPHPYRTMTEETFVTVCILDKPVLWRDNQQVQAVFLVSVSKTKNPKIQDFYTVTARLLLSKEYIEELISKKDYETLEKLISSVSEQLEG